MLIRKITHLLIVQAIIGLAITHLARAQGQSLDSLESRLAESFTLQQVSQLKTMIPNYPNQRVWGLAIGDFSNDRHPDLALSLYDLSLGKNQVRVYLLQNDGVNG